MPNKRNQKPWYEIVSYNVHSGTDQQHESKFIQELAQSFTDWFWGNNEQQSSANNDPKTQASQTTGSNTQNEAYTLSQTRSRSQSYDQQSNFEKTTNRQRSTSEPARFNPQEISQKLDIEKIKNTDPIEEHIINNTAGRNNDTSSNSLDTNDMINNLSTEGGQTDTENDGKNHDDQVSNSSDEDEENNSAQDAADVNNDTLSKDLNSQKKKDHQNILFKQSSDTGLGSMPDQHAGFDQVSYDHQQSSETKDNTSDNSEDFDDDPTEFNHSLSLTSSKTNKGDHQSSHAGGYDEDSNLELDEISTNPDLNSNDGEYYDLEGDIDSDDDEASNDEQAELSSNTSEQLLYQTRTDIELDEYQTGTLQTYADTVAQGNKESATQILKQHIVNTENDPKDLSSNEYDNDDLSIASSPENDDERSEFSHQGHGDVYHQDVETETESDPESENSSESENEVTEYYSDSGNETGSVSEQYYGAEGPSKESEESNDKKNVQSEVEENSANYEGNDTQNQNNHTAEQIANSEEAEVFGTFYLPDDENQNNSNEQKQEQEQEQEQELEQEEEQEEEQEQEEEEEEEQEHKEKQDKKSHQPTLYERFINLLNGAYQHNPNLIDEHEREGNGDRQEDLETQDEEQAYTSGSTSESRDSDDSFSESQQLNESSNEQNTEQNNNSSAKSWLATSLFAPMTYFFTSHDTESELTSHLSKVYEYDHTESESTDLDQNESDDNKDQESNNTDNEQQAIHGRNRSNSEPIGSTYGRLNQSLNSSTSNQDSNHDSDSIIDKLNIDQDKRLTNKGSYAGNNGEQPVPEKPTVTMTIGSKKNNKDEPMDETTETSGHTPSTTSSDHEPIVIQRLRKHYVNDEISKKNNEGEYLIKHRYTHNGENKEDDFTVDTSQEDSPKFTKTITEENPDYDRLAQNMVDLVKAASAFPEDQHQPDIVIDLHYNDDNDAMPEELAKAIADKVNNDPRLSVSSKDNTLLSKLNDDKKIQKEDKKPEAASEPDEDISHKSRAKASS